ncbi:CDP-glycerol glycerophosphotransferase family protein [Bacillus sp. PK6-026]
MPLDKKVILYAPTWRGTEPGPNESYDSRQTYYCY